MQSNLRGALQPLDDATFTQFVQLAFYNSWSGAPELSSVDWPRVLAELSALAEERKLPDRTLAYLDHQRAYYVAAVSGQSEFGLALLEAALARYRDPTDYRADLALLAENIERDAEHWSEAREYLRIAEESTASLPSTSDVVGRFHGDSAEMWIDVGATELARPHVEFELRRARETGDPAACLRACVDELKLLAAEEDYAAIDARFDEIFCEPWFAHISPADQGLCLLQVATGFLSAEHDEFAARGRGAMLLDDLIGAGKIDASTWPWAVRARAIAAADAGDWELARKLCDTLRGEISVSSRPPRRLAAALVEIEARIELAQSVGALDRERRLRPHLERMRRSRDEFLARWSKAPVRSGGLQYLNIADRHQDQLLIELELAVEGESLGTSRALQAVLDGEQQSTLSRRMQLPPAAIDEVRRELTNPHAGVLVYAPSRDRSFVFAIDSLGVRLFRIGALYRLRAPCRALAAAAQSAVRTAHGIDDPDLLSAAVDCKRAMMPPALEEHIAAWRELLVVGIDDCGYVPFELLPAREGGTQGACRAISYCPTVAMALAQRRAPTPHGGHARFLLAPDSGDSTVALALNDGELREIASAMSSEPEILVGSAAVAPLLGISAGDDVAMLYVLAHGVHDAARERPGGLRMARSASSDGIVRAEDVEALRAPPLVLLTACEVGRAPMRLGDRGRSDLAAAFLYAGAHTVVLPTCDLELDATLRAVPRILRSLSCGDETAEALRVARADLVARRDPVAALQAHLLHVVGCGGTSLRPNAPAPRASIFSGAIWVLLPAAVVLALWLVRACARERASRAAMPHGSRSD